MEVQKPVHTLVLDTGAIIKNEVPVSSLLNQSESLVTIPAVISEIKDAATRSRVENTLRPFLTLKSPSTASINFVTEFARRTGDLPVLSKPDVHIIALAYEIECERNEGDWRLRRVPGQRRLNGSSPFKSKDQSPILESSQLAASLTSSVTPNEPQSNLQQKESDSIISKTIVTSEATSKPSSNAEQSPHLSAGSEINSSTKTISATDDPTPADSGLAPKLNSAQDSREGQEDSDSDSEGWITPSNLKKKQAEDTGLTTMQAPEPKAMQVAVLTTDFAMQNVILQMNLNLLSPSLSRVKHLRTFVLRCHACFQVTKDMSKQFCPRCGQPSLTRVSCSTDANGEFKLHLKKTMQWNRRGDKYSIPKPVHGSANGKVKGGGKGSWGSDLILTEDQKEYQRATAKGKKQTERDLMDQDDLPSILTGDRGKSGGRIKIGAGRSVNATKR